MKLNEVRTFTVGKYTWTVTKVRNHFDHSHIYYRMKMTGYSGSVNADTMADVRFTMKRYAESYAYRQDLGMWICTL